MTMNLSIKAGLVAAITTAAFGLAIFGLAPSASAATGTACTDITVGGGVDCIGTGGSASSVESVVKTVVNIMLFVIGIIAVVMLIVGGIRYVASAGDQNAVQGAKNTILYAIVGLVIAFMAWAVVRFVVSRLAAPPATVAPTV